MTDTDRCKEHSKQIRDVEILVAKQGEHISNNEKDINAVGKVMREDFKSVWKAIDIMLFKVGVVVTLTSSIVMAVFKIIESGK